MKQNLIVFTSFLFLFGYCSITLNAQNKHDGPEPSNRDKAEVYERVNRPDRSWTEIAKFTSKGKWGVKDRKGKIIVRPLYDEISRFQSFDETIIARVRRTDKWGLIDYAGKEVIHPKYDELTDFRWGRRTMDVRAIARIRLNGKWGYVNSAGREIVPPKYDEIDDDFHYDAMIARVRRNGKWGYVNSTGREIIAPKYNEISDFFPLPYLDAGQITRAGNDLHGFVARVRLNDKLGYVDIADKEIVPIKYDELPDRTALNKFIKVKLNGKYGYLDATGKEVVPAKYDEAPENLYDNTSKTRVLRRVTQNSKYGYLDRVTGEEIIPPRYDAGPEFVVGGKTRVKRDGKWGYVDTQGREVSPFTAEPDPCAYVKKKGQNYVFGEETIMRSMPDVSSDVIAKLPAGGTIKIISETSTDATFGDETDRWYRVEDQGKPGFVWGGSLADSAFTVPVDGKERLFLIRNRTNGTNLCYQPKFEIKMLLEGKKIAEFSGYPFIRVTTRMKSMEYVAMEGFSAPLKLLRVMVDTTGYKDTYDRYGTGIVYFDIAHGKLNKVLELGETTGDVDSKPIEFSTELVLPDNRQRVDKIIVKVFVSSQNSEKKLFNQVELRWDWNERIFKQK